MNVLILGGSRFQGKYLCNALANKGHTLTIFNRGLSGNVPYHENIKYIKGDRKEKSAFENLLDRRYDICVDTSGYEEVDVAKSSKEIKTEKYIYISSIFVYKQCEEIVSGKSPIDARITNKYGREKIKCENILRKQLKEDQLLIIRPSMLAGVGDHTERMRLAIKLAKNDLVPNSMLKNKAINLINIKDYIENLAHYIEGNAKGIKNITGVNTTIGHLWETIETMVETKKNKKREVCGKYYIPYSEGLTNNKYKVENAVDNKFNLNDTLKEIIEKEDNKILTRYNEIREKYLIS